MDLATILGLIIAFGALIVAVNIEGGQLIGFANLSAAFIVLGGTFGVTAVAHSTKQILRTPIVLKNAFFTKPIDAKELMSRLVEFSRKARREGILALEEDVRGVNIPFIQRGMSLVIDGTSPEMVQEILDAELASMQARHQEGISVFEAMGGFAPTLGILGTVMGLVNMLANLSEPDEMGHAIAAAFIATLYGVGTANLIFLPIANKLKARSQEETHSYELAMEGILAIQNGDGPRVVASKMQAYVAPKDKESAQEGSE